MKNFRIVICLSMIVLLFLSQFSSPLMVRADSATQTALDTATPPPPTDTPVPSDTPVVTDTPIASDTPTVDTPTDPAITDTPITTDTSTAADTATPEAVTSTDTPTLDLATATETPIPSDTLAVDTTTPADAPTIDPATAAETPVSSDTSVVDTATATVAPTMDPAIATDTTAVDSIVTSADQPTLLETIPDNTNVIVLDQNGEPLSLVTQQAAGAIATGDPMWCPTGVPPIANTGGCTQSTDSFNDHNGIPGLLSLIANKTQAGTIWIASTYDSNIADTSGVVLNGSSLGTTADHALTLQGGWDGTSGPNNSTGTTTIKANLSIINWNNNITLNNISNVNSSNPGAQYWFQVVTSGNVNISNSDFSQAFGALVQHVKFNGVSSNRVTTQPNQSVTVTFDYEVWNDTHGHAGAINQLVPFLGDIPGGYCAYDGGPLNSHVTGSDAHTYTIPSSSIPGYSYYFIVNHQLEYTCADAIAKSSGTSPQAPIVPAITTVSADGKIQVTIYCNVSPIHTEKLPNGDRVTFHCPRGAKKMEAEIDRTDNITLPSQLPDGYAYSSGFQVKLKIDDRPVDDVLGEGGYIIPSFVSQSLEPGNSYTILYFDEGQQSWVQLQDYLMGPNGQAESFPLYPGNDTDKRSIFSGVQFKNDDQGMPRVKSEINFPGTFVLAQHQ